VADASLREFQRTELILPRQANHYGTLFAPEALSMLGQTAYLAAARLSAQPVVMAAAHDIQFVAPVAVGSLLRMRAHVVRQGRCSMTVQVSAALDTAPGVPATEVLRGRFEMVSVDLQGRPVPLRTRGDMNVAQAVSPTFPQE
jgi:acyl-CoA hydrolase